MQRREYMASVAALASAKWAEEGIEIEGFNGQERADPGVYETGSFTPTQVLAVGSGPVADWMLASPQIPQQTLRVWYHGEGVSLSVGGRGEDRDASMTIDLSPELAKEVAVAFYQAAEEQQGVEWGETWEER